jgi:catechol 2,3-dioxygenase-like lactoylglutathione lyase family enzyme
MELEHVALVCRSEENADLFYRDLLGLRREERKILPRELALRLFGLDEELTVINYQGGVHFEVFIRDRGSEAVPPIPHVCLQVPDVDAFLDRCRALDIHVLRLPKGDKVLTFVYDRDGNSFEIK